MISKRMNKIDSSGIRKVFNLAADMKQPVNLSIGQPDFDVPQEIKQEAAKAINSGFNRYTQTEGILELRERVCQKLKEKNNVDAKPKDVLITSGVSGGLFLAFYVLLDKGDEAIIFDPYFTMYKHLLNFIEAVPRPIDTYPDFNINIDKVKEAITEKTKVIVLNSPGNPTGKTYFREELEAVINIARENDLVIISDEVYEEFMYDGTAFSPGSIYDKTVTLNGFSKTYAMTGWRIGYAAGPNEIIQQMCKLQQYSFVCAPSFAQVAAIKSFECDMSEYIAGYHRKRDLVYEGLKDYFKLKKPGGGFYAFPQVDKITATTFVEKAIAKNLLIIPGNVFSEKDTNFRLSFAASNETIEKGIKILIELAQG
ncbi:MAG: pyridoxal phosphate-dependent aminotransferase [bacterium]|nr:pyridoxal phosphate-dependent aminotransferase [bacterium]